MNLKEALAVSENHDAFSKRFSLAAYYVIAYGKPRLGIVLSSVYEGDHIICGSPKTRYYPIPDTIRTHSHVPLESLPEAVRTRVESDEGDWKPYAPLSPLTALARSGNSVADGKTT